MTEPKTCFVIGPIGSKFAPIGSADREVYEDALQVFEQVIIPASERFGLDPVRADQIASSGEINEQIFRHLRDDDVVIADVSNANANVMYELGLRHTRPFLTIQIGEYGRLPFDITAVRTIQFSRSDRGLIDARKALESALEVGLSGDSEMVTATRLWNGASTLESLPPSEDEIGLPATPNEEDDAGFLEQMVAMEERFPVLNDITTRISKIIGEMGQLAESSTADLNNASVLNASTSSRLSLVARFGQRLQPGADSLLEAADEFASEMAAIDSGVRGSLRFVQTASGLEAEQYVPFLQSLQGTARSSREATEMLTQFDGSVAVLAGMSRTLKRPVDTISRAVRTMLSPMAVADEWEATISRIMKEKYSAFEDEDSSDSGTVLP